MSEHIDGAVGAEVNINDVFEMTISIEYLEKRIADLYDHEGIGIEVVCDSDEG